LYLRRDYFGHPALHPSGRPADVQNCSQQFCRIPDHLARSQVLYPAELRALYRKRRINVELRHIKLNLIFIPGFLFFTKWH